MLLCSFKAGITCCGIPLRQEEYVVAFLLWQDEYVVSSFKAGITCCGVPVMVGRICCGGPVMAG